MNVETDAWHFLLQGALADYEAAVCAVLSMF